MKQLDGMRKIEGAKILEDTMARINQITTTLGLLEKKVYSYKNEKHNMLRSKIKDLLAGQDLDESRLIQEVAYYSEKMDVTELIEKNNLTTTVFPINTNFFDFGDKAVYLKNKNKKKLF